MNCVADVRADRCDVWAPTQNPGAAKDRAVSLGGVPREAVRLSTTLVGGGFGRRLQVDYVGQAVEISRAVGAPVKLTWTREDDIQHDYYHPFTVHRVSAMLDPPSVPSVRTVTFGAQDFPTGAMRAVTNIPDAFVRECFLDELAGEIDRDPYELRMELSGYRSYHKVLELVATKADWYAPLPDGWGRGIACHSTWNVTPVAQVIDASVDQQGRLRVHRVFCAVDCGLVVNPDMVEAQMEGGIVFGLTTALKGHITLRDGRVEQSNFHDYPLLTIAEMPEIEVYIVPSEGRPTGVGEMGNPPAAPALLNAVFAATGKRIRHLPIRPDDLRPA
jgi:isoquinoline 1-oxidoreductase beta subunit